MTNNRRGAEKCHSGGLFRLRGRIRHRWRQQRPRCWCQARSLPANSMTTSLPTGDRSSPAFLTDVASCVALIDYDKDLIAGGRDEQAPASDLSQEDQHHCIRRRERMPRTCCARCAAAASEYLAKPIGEAEIAVALRRFQENQPAAGTTAKRLWAG